MTCKHWNTVSETYKHKNRNAHKRCQNYVPVLHSTATEYSLGRKSCLCMHKFTKFCTSFFSSHWIMLCAKAKQQWQDKWSNNWCIFITRQKAATRWQIFCLFSPSWETRCELYWEKYLVIVLFDDGIIEASSLLVLVLLHEEDMGHIQLPCVMLVAKLHRLAEDLLHLCTQEHSLV